MSPEVGGLPSPSAAPEPGDDAAPSPGIGALVACWVAWWVLCAALWLAFDDTVALPELIAGAVAAAIGATGATLVYAERLVAFRPRARWALRAWRPVAQVVPDLGLLAAVLVRALAGGERAPGATRAVRFDATGGEGERMARRALASAVGSVAPNTIVLDVDERNGVMLIHQLVPTSGDRASVDPLGLG